MGELMLSSAIAALNNGGIRADYAWPGGMMPAVTGIVAAVSLKEADLQEDTVTVQAAILCPMEMGGAACEAAALTAGQILMGIGGCCKVTGCELDGQTGLFCAQVAASFVPEAEPEKTTLDSFTLGQTNLHHVVSFTTHRQTEESVTEIDQATWYFRLEEFFPTDTVEEEWPEAPFSITNGAEILSDCTFTFHKRIREPGGIRQIREGIAGSRGTQ